MKNFKKSIRYVLVVLCFLIFIGSTTYLIIYFKDISYNKKLNDNLIKEVVKESDFVEDEDSLKIDFDRLISINKDVIGWIIYNDKKINYPVVYSKNQTYYLNRSFDKKYNQAGTIFMDYRNKSFDDRNVVLFGHAMLDKSMFGSLQDLFKKGYFDTEENNYIKIVNTDNEVLTYQIFSYYIIDSEEYYITTSFSSDKSFKDFLNTISKRSYKNFKIKLDENDHILTLSTCYGTGDTDQRKVVHAVRIEEDDE